MLKQTSSRSRGEAPVVSPAIHIVSTDLADAGDRDEYDSARFQDAVHRLHGRRKVENTLKGLCENDTVERLGFDVVRVRQITDDGDRLAILCNMKHVYLAYSVTAIKTRVHIGTNLQYVSVNVSRPTAEERFYVVAIEGTSAFETECGADRLHPSEISKAHQSNGWPACHLHEFASGANGKNPLRYCRCTFQ